MAVNPLANPKGIKLLCELCQKPALIQCTKCRLTYYCGAEHQNIDWIGIHEKVCQLLIPLRTPIPFASGSEEERKHRKEQQKVRQKQMIELTRTVGQKLLFEGKYEYAIPAAMQSLKFSIDVYGLASIELVPSYLILGEACIGLGRLPQAEEYLSQAQWTVLKTPTCSNAIKSRLYRNIGLLYATQGNSKEALRQFADDIYHSSLEFGTNNISTSGGYFHMANVFFRQNKLDVAFSLYSQVTEIWFDHLNNLVDQRIQEPPPPSGIGPAQIASEKVEFDHLDEAQEAEVVQVLGAILELRENQAVQTPSTMCSIYFTTAMMHLVLNNFEKARIFGTKALESSQAGVTIEESMKNRIEEFLKAVDRLL
ncbi:zinc finger MYND domain-containing protein 12-like [Rhopilema esculentum]|uniref:zinc finger MYND domain-containing protein 12-like n=1 Tax=Rhopilema esculentum TaxID=499914 RepID=UPI0031DBFB82|eukprot:gene7222-12904_t